jgi:hypothetical protein
MKRVLATIALALVSTWVVLASAVPKTVTIEPDDLQCVTRCYYILDVPIICYDSCY